MERCIFLLTGDLHGRLSDDSAENIRELRLEDSNSLLLDAGDAIETGNLGIGKRSSPILEQMSRLSYDAMVMGNRESHPFKAAIERKLSSANFPILAANLRSKRKPIPNFIKEYIFKQLPNGISVTLSGLAPQITPPGSKWSKITDYIFEKPETIAAELAEKVKGKNDIFIMLSHCGIAIDRNLAKIDGIDLILGGHSHIEIFETDYGSPIFHSGYLGKRIGRLEVLLECGRITKVKAELRPLGE